MQRLTYQQFKQAPRALTLNFSALSAQIWANELEEERSKPLSGKLFGGSGFGAVAGSECALELTGVLEVLAVGDGEAVGSVEFLAGAEIDVFVGLGFRTASRHALGGTLIGAGGRPTCL